MIEIGSDQAVPDHLCDVYNNGCESGFIKRGYVYWNGDGRGDGWQFGSLQYIRGDADD